MYGTETLTLGKLDQKYLQSFEMWCWRRMGEISWIDRVRNERVLQSHGAEEHATCSRRRNVNWIGHILRRNSLIKHVSEGKIEGRICHRKTRKKT